MKMKKYLISLFLLFSLVFSLSAVSSAEWKTVDGKKYYYSNGSAVTGLKSISGKKYLFRSTGELVMNCVVKYNNKLYVCKADGSILTTWGKFNNKSYYGTSGGSLKTGLQKYKNNYYYFSPEDGAMVKKAWMDIDGRRYYFYSTGKAGKGKICTIAGLQYYFNSKAQMVTGIQRVGKYYYCFGKTTGKMQKGTVHWGKYYYYFNPTTGRALTNAWKTLSSKKYYYDSQGRRVTGWLVLGSKKYYLDPDKKGAMVTGKKTIDGRTYNFGSKGYVTVSKANMRVTVNKKKCIVTVYENDVPIKAMYCSPGRSDSPTPSGVFTVMDHLSWHMLDGPSLGQYCSHFLPNYLFHSVPMHTTTRDPYKVEAKYYNRLGTPASAGCVRLAVADAKWIYENIPIGTTVAISDSQKTPLTPRPVTKMPSGTVGADPTDDFKNPAGYDVKIK